MARPRNSLPKYCVGKSGRAFCKHNGEFISLGADGPEAKLKYASVLVQLQTGRRVEPARDTAQSPALSCNELCLAFITHAQTEYVDRATGKPSAEVDCFKSATKHLRLLFGETPAAELGPNKLRSVRDAYIAAGWSRKFINKSVGRIRQIWRWGVAREMVPATILEGLRALEPLKEGKSKARETGSREAVPIEHVNAVKEKLRQRNRDIVDLLLLTAARPSEILCLTTGMIQNAQVIDGVWAIDLKHHKTGHHGHARTILFNAAAQVILQQYLQTDKPEARLFPIQRKTLGQAVKDACERAGVPEFTPHWLRHTTVTKLTDEAGAEAAQRVAGHANINMTADYSKAAKKRAVEAVKLLG